MNGIKKNKIIFWFIILLSLIVCITAFQVESNNEFIIEDNSNISYVSINENFLEQEEIREEESNVLDFLEESIKIEVPTETLTLTPTVIPTETLTEIPTEMPIETLAETSIEILVETPMEMSTETLTEMTIETLIETPIEILVETLAEIPSETPIETLSETPEVTPEIFIENFLSETPILDITEVTPTFYEINSVEEKILLINNEILTQTLESEDIEVISIENDIEKIELTPTPLITLQFYLKNEVTLTPTVEIPPLQVAIFSSRKSQMLVGEPVYLTSELKNAEYYSMFKYQWECDKGNGWELVEGATSNSYSFPATTETLSWSWHLIVYYK